MAKKASKVVLNPKAEKVESDVEVTNEPKAKIEQVDPATLESIAVEPISDEELDALIEDAQARYQELTGKEPWSPMVVMTEELAKALETRNQANRFATPRIVDTYTERFLGNRVDSAGNFVQGTIQWEQGLPAQVMLSEEGNLHNSQKCIKAYRQALKLFDLNQKEAASDKRPTDFEDYAEDRGITREMLENAFTAVVVKGMPESAADYVDTAQQRTNTDLTFRRHLFDQFDYSGLFKGLKRHTNEPLESFVRRRDEKQAAYYQEQSKLYATALGFVAKRIWDNGKLPRDKSSLGSAFTQDQYKEASEYFPQLADSVNYVWRTIGKGPSKKRALALGLSLQYLSTAHYLASMHDASWSDSEGWLQTEEGKADADAFIKLIVSPKTGNDKHPQLTTAVVNWQDALEALHTAGDKSDATNNAIFNSIAYVWRTWKFGRDDGYVHGTVLKNTLETDPASQYCPFSQDDESDDSFDRRRLEGDAADIAATQLAAKQAKEEEEEKKASKPTKKAPPSFKTSKK